MYLNPFSNIVKRVDFKRQESDIDQCLNEKLESSSVDEACMVAESQLGSDNDAQEGVNEVFQVICRPECLEFFMEANDECGVFRDAPYLRDFYSGVCEMNENGQTCYKLFSRASQFIIDTEYNCF